MFQISPSAILKYIVKIYNWKNVVAFSEIIVKYIPLTTVTTATGQYIYTKSQKPEKDGR